MQPNFYLCAQTKKKELMKKLVLLMAAGGFLLASCASNPEGEKAVTSDAVEGSVANGESYNVDASASGIKWTGNKVTGSHHGTINIQSGTLLVDNGQLSGGQFVIDMNSIVNEDLTDPEYKGKLEGHLKADDFFAVDKHPTSTFEITEVTDQGNGAIGVSGNLTIRDITKNITFNATASENTADKIVVDADFNINRKDWNVMYEGQKDDLISDEINYKVHLEATK